MPLILVAGGCRSGKTEYAQSLAVGRTCYLATGQGKDPEMRERIARHRRNRPHDWTTLEEPLEITRVLREQAGKFDTVLIDCLGLWLTNLMGEADPGKSEKRLLKSVEELIETAGGGLEKVIVVSNETGMGVVPANELARFFRDVNGLANQMIARAADEVYKLEMGIPSRLK